MKSEHWNIWKPKKCMFIVVTKVMRQMVKLAFGKCILQLWCKSFYRCYNHMAFFHAGLSFKNLVPLSFYLPLILFSGTMAIIFQTTDVIWHFEHLQEVHISLFYYVHTIYLYTSFKTKSAIFWDHKLKTSYCPSILQNISTVLWWQNRSE